MRRPFSSWLLPGACLLVAVGACGSDGGTRPETEDPGPPASVTVTPASATVELPGRTLPLSATARDAAGRVVSGASFAWTSSDPSVAEVDDAGRARTVGPGTAEVTAAIEGVRGSASLTVTGATDLGFLDGTFTVIASGPSGSRSGSSRFVDVAGALEEIRTEGADEVVRALTRLGSDGRSWIYARADGARLRMEVFRGQLVEGENRAVAETASAEARVVVDRISEEGFRLRLQRPDGPAWTDVWTEEYQR